MNKEDGLTISEWTKGISSSPHVGFGDMRNLDVFSRPGVARINYGTFKVSAGTVTGLPKWIRRDPSATSRVYSVDDGGGAYRSTDDGATWHAFTGTYTGVGAGLEIWKNYAFLAGTTTLYVRGPLSGTPITYSFKTIDSDALFHPMMTSKNDGMLYGGAGRYFFSLEEVSGQTFDPNNSATYTWTQQALDLPANYRVKCLCELGEKLLGGTWMGSNIYDIKVADIFPWDRSSPSFETPISVDRNGIHSMLNINNIVYFLAGIDGEIFSTNGVQSALLGKIPVSITGMEAGYWMEPLPGALVNHKGRPFFGISGGAGVLLPGMGVWSLVSSKDGNVLVYENSISTGNDGTSAKLAVGALLPGQINTLLIGWQDGSSYGIDQVSNQLKYATGTYQGVASSYPAYAESPFYRVGTNLVKKLFQYIEFQLDKPLSTGQGIKLKYRTDLSASFTTIGTYDFVTPGAVQSHRVLAGIPACEFLQIRVEMTTGSSSATTPELRAVKVT
jgi:hypothetical protein